jgi:hypothetical protein
LLRRCGTHPCSRRPAMIFLPTCTLRRSAPRISERAQSQPADDV